MAGADKIYELFFENSIDLLCVINSDGIFEKINPEWEFALGYAPYEMEGEKFTDFLHPDDIEKTLEEAKHQATNKNRVSNFVNRYKHKDGSYRWIEWRSFLLEDLVYASARDISQRVNAEEALKESEERNKIINSLTSDFVYQIKINTKKEKSVIYVSEEFKTFTGLTIEDFKENNLINSIFHPEDLKKIEEFEKGIIANEARNSIHCRFLNEKRSGWFNLTGKAIYNSQTGRVSSYFFAAKNITKHKKAHEELEERGKLLDGIAQNIPGLVFQFYADNNNHWGVSYVSNSSNKFIELNNKELDGFFERFIDLIPEKEKESFMHSIKEAVAHKSPWTYEGVFIKNKSKELRHFKALSSPRILDDKLVFDGILLDITESKKKELEYQELSKLHQTILDTITAGLIFAKESKFVWANNAYLNIHNSKLEDISGKKLSHFFANKEDYEKIRLKALDDFANKRAFSKEIATKNTDGTTRWVNFTGNPISFEKPNEGTVWMVQDVTERKKNEEKVKQLAEMQQTILDTVGVGIAYVKNRKAQWGNSTYLKMFGFEFDNTSIPSSIEYKTKEDFDRIGRDGYKALAQGLIYNTNVEVKKSDGSNIWIYLSGKAIDPRKPNEGSIWTAQNITEAVNNEIELRKSEAILKSTIESINDGLLVVDENGEITNYNTCFNEIFDFPEDIIIKNDDNLLIEYAKNKLKNPEEFTNNIKEIYKTKENTEDLLEFVDGRFIERLSFHLQEDSPVDGRVWLFRDITEKKLTEENLIKNQKILTDSQRIAKIGSWDLDLTDLSVIWNKSTYEIFGYKRFDEPITLETFFQFVHEEDRDFVRNLVDESIKNKKLKDFECKVIRLDNLIIDVIIVGEITLNENGEPVRMFGVVQDISERKQYEAALEKRVLALTRPLDDLSNIELTDLFSIDDLQKIQDSFAKATGVASIITYPDGKPITKPSNFCNLCKIIRSTKKGETKCQESDALLGKINYSGPTIQPCLSVGLWNAGASITLGGVHIANWLIGQIRNEEQDEKAMLKYADEIGVEKEKFLEAIYEVDIMSKENFEDISNALYILASELSLKAYQNVQQARFISSQKKAEEEVRELNKNLEKKVEERTQRLNEVNKDLEAFAYSVSHDLRAPLRHIDGYTRLLYSGVENPSDSVKDYFIKVKGSIVRMTHMIDDLLSFSRLGRREINMHQVEMKKLINDIVFQYDNLPEKLNINWIIYKLPRIKGDPNMLKLAFENLISNAVKYSSKNEEIIIEIGALDLNENVEFFVKDNGVGFDMNYAENLFGVFQRLHKGEDFEGVGIGLANVKQIINKHNGSVRAESEVDKGATFYVTLPK